MFDAALAGDRAALCELLASGVVRFIDDRIEEQILELVASREPSRTLDECELGARATELTGGLAVERYGVWVHYPWSARLVHVLPEAAFRELRTDRNRYKITASEQRTLGRATIGIIGLSVGNMAALTCALEGVGTRFRLADFDTLSLSNMNRLRAAVGDLGVEKSVLAARQMFEIDPFLSIERYPEGITRDRIDAFLLDGGRLDVLIEECDDLFVKVMVRERARAHGIAVLMDTSDRGLLDVERFDQEPERPILHGLLGDVRADSLLGLATKDKAPYLLAILGEEAMSTRFAASLPEVKESLAGWPQLASSVALGGAVVADVARRLLLGAPVPSGRYYVDLDAIVDVRAAALREPAAGPPPIELAPEALRAMALPPEPPPHVGDGPPPPETVRWLVAAGTLAPSAHNAQPWRFRWADGTLSCMHDPRHDMPTLDFEHGATWLAFGAFVENLRLAAAAVGLDARVAPFPDPRDPSRVCEVRFQTGPVVRSPLLSALALRVTNRKRGPRVALPPGEIIALEEAARARGGRLELRSQPDDLDEIGALMGACDRITQLHEGIHHETMSGFRWTRAEVEATRDGIDVATLELSPSDRAGLRLLSRWASTDALERLGGGRALEDPAKKAIASSSAVGLVTMPGASRTSFFEGGRAVEHLWLTATSLGLALQPMTSLPYLFARLERGRGEGLSEAERASLAGLRVRYRRLFTTESSRAEVLLFRVGRADAPTARALRRHVDDVLEMA